MSNSTDNPDQLTPEHARELAGDLLRELVEHVGDDEAVTAVMLRWFDVLNMRGLSLVAMAAVRLTFSECLT